ncbi:ABC transporter G family member 27 [Actinidia rufa]|uniref:ABC transporter G family member 27 n=1 Tax=Actinidia rufa TaxID=165716 RepID=A0A7J0DGB8_9ERIC|nr:ABC transporter G family member 27 [Actinidia rufa]
MRSVDLKTASPSGKNIRKTKSLSAQFLVNVDELISNVAGGFEHETGLVLSRASSHRMGIFSLAGSSVGSDDLSCGVRLQNFCDVTKIYHSSTADEEDHNSSSGRKIHIEPTLPIYLNFQDVKYKATVKGPLEWQSDSERCILHGVTGSVRPGEVLALMGPSGGGKTTLLNLLSGRVKLKSGTITYNDQPYGKSLKQRIGFVLQDDIVFSHLTVKETLTYAALLRLPNSLTREQKKERAMNVLTELGLERCQDTVIGGAFVRGISGGERKRLCIGNEILLNPSLLFLDEPTSGLDSTTALRIVQMLHSIAEAGKTVVTTIHQPSSTIFSKFDKLILLGKGSSLYFGKASEVMVYFSSIGCSPLIAMNPAEFLIDLANGNMKDKSVPSELEDKFLPQSPSPKKLEPKYAGPSPLDVHEYLVGAHEAKLTSTDKAKVLKPMLIEVETQMQGWANSREWGATWWQQFSILFLRGLKERRHEYFSSVRVTQAGLLFFVSVFWAFFPILTAIFTFPQERAMLVKERSVDMYRLSAYLVARNISDLPLDLTLPIVFLVIVYFMAGLKLSFTAFSLTLLTVLLSIVASQGLGLTIGAAFMDVKKATTLASIIVMAFMLSGGFFIQEVPSFMLWVRYVSINYHTYRLLQKIQYGCSGSGSGSCEPPFIRGQILGWGGIEVASMLVMIVGYRILAYFFLRRMKLRTLA